uniref:Myb-like domain-containing protein n=1 Tax=Brassica oleracea var. oleracea TaxID=109376 RepID=A0A0D3ANK4_BRAOL
MDHFSLNSPRFVNLLASQSSPPIDVDSAEAAVNSPGLVKPAERRKWSTKEDIVLISAWLNTSKDPITFLPNSPLISLVLDEQKLGAFWKRIEEYFNSSPQLIGSLPREWSQCKQRWGRVNAEVCKFVGCHETALKEQASGQSENDVMKAAHDIFLNDYHVKFDQKWRSHSQSKKKRKEACADVVPDEEEFRPPGVKASKAAKRKKPNKAVFDQIQSILAQKNTISKQKILDRLLAKNIDTLSDHKVALKNKLITEML